MPFRPGQLHYFVTVAQEGQITRAARKLHIAQPALSQAIAQLETDLGLTLLERHARGVTLTEAGDRFLEKARVAVAADRDALQTAQSLARAQTGVIEFGFLGTPPGLDSPAPLAAFAEAHPSIDIRYRDLPFPSKPTSAWLSEVDLAVCHRPAADPKVWTQPLRTEPRVVLAPKHHRVADRSELTVAEILDETFIGFHASIDPGWAGFWSLDDHRGEPPAKVTPDRTANAQEVLASLAVRHAITTVPAAVGRVLVNVLPVIVAIPVHDAEPSSIVLVGHERRMNPSVAILLAFAKSRPSRPAAR